MSEVSVLNLHFRNHANAIKHFTSFSGRKRHLAGNAVRKAEFDEIPIISLADSEQEIVEQLRDACTRVGFFYISV